MCYTDGSAIYRRVFGRTWVGSNARRTLTENVNRLWRRQLDVLPCLVVFTSGLTLSTSSTPAAPTVARQVRPRRRRPQPGAKAGGRYGRYGCVAQW